MKGVNYLILNDQVIIQALEEYFDKRWVGKLPFKGVNFFGNFGTNSQHKLVIAEVKTK